MSLTLTGSNECDETYPPLVKLPMCLKLFFLN